MSACACMYAECAKAGRCLAGTTPNERAIAGAKPLPVYYSPQEVAPISTRSSTAGSTDKGCDPADERAAFEAWALKTVCTSPADLVRFVRTGYAYSELNQMFVGWKGARAAIGQPAPTGEQP